MTKQAERKRLLAEITEAASEHDGGDPQALDRFNALIDQAQNQLGAADPDLLLAELTYLQAALRPLAKTYVLRNPDHLPDRMAAAGITDPVVLARAAMASGLTELRSRIGGPLNVEWVCGLDPTRGYASAIYERAFDALPLIEQIADASGAVTRAEHGPNVDEVVRLVKALLEADSMDMRASSYMRESELAALRSSGEPTTVEGLVGDYLTYWGEPDPDQS